MGKRSRPYKKNDNCFVGQKNDSAIRRITGYYRFEGEEAGTVMTKLYETYNLPVNYFFPSMKIISKQRIDSKVSKKYDEAKTSFSRLLEHKELLKSVKTELIRRKNSLDLESLLIKTQEFRTKLISLVIPWSS